MKNLIDENEIDFEKIELSMDETYHLFNGVPLYEKKFDSVMNYHAPGVAAISDKSGAYHINVRGDPLYQKQFIKAFGFYKEVAAVADDSGWYHVDLDGNSMYNERYDWVGNYQEERCTVRDKNGCYFHIKTDGTPAYNEKYQYAGDYKYGIAVVYESEGFAKHINKSGNLIHKRKYRELGVFHKGYATSRDTRGAFHINKAGEPLYRERYKWVEPFYNGFAFVCKNNGEKLIINEKGDIIHEIYNQNSSIIQITLRKQLMGMLVSYWKTQIIHSIVELNILDLIKKDYNDFNKLLKASNLPKPSLRMIIQVLKIWDFIEKKDGIYHLKYLGILLTEEYPESLKYPTLMWGEEHYQSMSMLTDALKYYKPQFEKIYGKPLFNYFSSNKDKGFIFNKAMAAYSLDYDKIIELYDFSDTKIIMDIGGGTGNLLEKILSHNKHIQKGILFDLPNVIKNAKKSINNDLTKEKIEFVSGNFFEDIPVKADIIIISRILHDWNDDNTVKILRNINNALEENGRLLIVEIVAPEDPEYDIGITLNFNLLVNVGGKERTLREFDILLQKVDFKISSVKRGKGIISIIIADKRN